MELALIRRYLQALQCMVTLDPAFVHHMMTELAHPLNQISDLVQPIHQAPMHTLTIQEQQWRRIAERIKQ